MLHGRGRGKGRGEEKEKICKIIGSGRWREGWMIVCVSFPLYAIFSEICRSKLAVVEECLYLFDLDVGESCLEL